MVEIAEKLTLFTGVSIFSYPTDSLVPPGGFVGYPERIIYDETYGRGEDIFSNLIVIMASDRTDSESSRDQVSEWTDPTSNNSVKTFLDNESYSSCGGVIVKNAEFEVMSIAKVDYLVAMFELDVTGEGT